MSSEQRRALVEAANQILATQWSKGDRQRARQAHRAVKLAKMRAKATALAPTPPACPSEPTGVYVIGPTGGPIKVGITSEVGKRLAQLQTASALRLRIYLHIDGLGSAARLIERAVHRRLADCRLAGEWFDVEWRQAALIIREEVDRHIAALAHRESM